MSVFVSFSQLHTSLQEERCIYFTKSGSRCRSSIGENGLTIRLRALGNEDRERSISLELLEELVVHSCCERWHRSCMVASGLSIPLASRWQDEIRRSGNDEVSAIPHNRKGNRPTTFDALVPTYPDHVTSAGHCTKSPVQHQSVIVKSSRLDRAPPAQEPIPLPNDTLVTRTTYPFAHELSSFENSYRYDLRSRATRSSPVYAASESPQPEFRPHKVIPKSNDSVFHRIQLPLRCHDFKTGSNYIFNRASSPGYVKIGWSAHTATYRVGQWSKCGYEPRLLFGTENVPHAQRVEKLTHYELMKEWRREPECNRGTGCHVQHQEWFEVDVEKAVQILADWADFMERAQPYDENGYLKRRWVTAVESMNRNGELITGRKLLEMYERSVTVKATLVEAASQPFEPAPRLCNDESLLGSKALPDTKHLWRTALTKIEAQLRAKRQQKDRPVVQVSPMHSEMRLLQVYC